ncbi:hypothetical protein JTE90_013064 [Oedothorax gibbosus]|uniref:Reverse transcriptase domain-containing protein n=1 Tax=Oedothorax gibbosus TaxID=931172 RepID=A0AAV6TJI1_9ARAC|nr:hypothetical protein JTE90_013064 [Oedothorax gibbosus]
MSLGRGEERHLVPNDISDINNDIFYVNPEPTDHTWVPFSVEEVHKALPSSSSSPGPDGVTPRELKSIGAPLLTIILNLALLCGGLPPRFTESRTIFIPKSSDSIGPGDFRPISISSVICRCLHKVFANILAGSLGLQPEQRAFIKEDGINENLFLLDLVLNRARSTFKDTHLAAIDLTKAFDSMSHASIITALATRGVDRGFINYIRDLYANSITAFHINGQAGEAFHPTCGVRQGDPLSPILFNLVVDTLITKIKESPVGISIDGIKVAVSAYADDLILFAETKLGLQSNLNLAQEVLSSCNLLINSSKSFTLSILADARNRQTKVVPGNFTVNQAPLPSVGVDGSFKYLGLMFNSFGLIWADPASQIQDLINTLKGTPLKCNQKLFIVRNILIPKVFHASILSRTPLGVLKKADIRVRDFIRKILHLPKDCPNAYIHANVDDGGLGVTSLRTKVPELRLKRLEKLKRNMPEEAIGGSAGDFLLLNIKKAIDNCVGTFGRLYWRDHLSQSVDGTPLAGQRVIPKMHSWVAAHNPSLVGRDFANAIKLRINALPTNSRLRRGRAGDRYCRAGCRCKETLNHILQNCARTHGKRIARHDHIVNNIKAHLEQKGCQVFSEPIFDTPVGKRKPDIIAIRQGSALVIDAQVVGDSVDLNRAHRRKVNYYADNVTLVDGIKALYGVDVVRFYSTTLNWRGVWSQESLNSLLEERVIPRSMIPSLPTKVLIGGLASFNFFCKSTSSRARV